jgi:hypothetical protein
MPAFELGRESAKTIFFMTKKPVEELMFKGTTVADVFSKTVYAPAAPPGKGYLTVVSKLNRSLLGTRKLGKFRDGTPDYRHSGGRYHNLFVDPTPEARAWLGGTDVIFNAEPAPEGLWISVSTPGYPGKTPMAFLPDVKLTDLLNPTGKVLWDSENEIEHRVWGKCFHDTL